MPEQKVTSLDPLFANRISLIHNGQAGQGAGRGPGVRPTIFAGRPVIGKTSGMRLASCAPMASPLLQDAILLRIGYSQRYAARPHGSGFGPGALEFRRSQVA